MSETGESVGGVEDPREDNLVQMKTAASRVDENGCEYIMWAEHYQAYRNWCIGNGEEPHTSMKYTMECKKVISDFESRFKAKRVDGKVVWVLMDARAVYPDGGSQF